MAGATPFRLRDGRLLVALKVQPGAARDAIAGVETLADGSRVLKVKVTAPPESGKANAAVLRLLTKAWKLPKGRLAIAAGETARVKTLAIAGADAALPKRLAANPASV